MYKVMSAFSGSLETPQVTRLILLRRIPLIIQFFIPEAVYAMLTC